MSIGRKLHKDGSFHEQKVYVDSLPTSCEDDELNRTINSIKAKSNPFDVDASLIPSQMDVTVFHHTVTDVGESDSDDEENEMKSSNAVITRQLKISGQSKTEKMVMHFPDKDQTSQTFKIKFKPDGSVTVHKKDVAMPTLQRDLLFADGRKQEGIVVEAHDTEKNTRRYSAYTKK
jgi:hypothetical protein